jgi:hypothetical protein
MISLLTEEFELIVDDKLREFAVDAVSLADEDTPKKTVDYIKRVVGYVNEFCDVIDAEGLVRDTIIVASLIHCVFDDGTVIYPYKTRIMLNSLLPTVGREAFNNIMYLVERQQGFHSPFVEFQPVADTPIHAWLLPLAIKLAKKE